jgi:transcriptional regulator with XRE-family HTH domain
MAKDEFKVEFGRRLRLIARERGFSTTEEIAEFAGATRAAVDTWLNGRALPKWEQAARLAAAWHVTLDWLATGRPDGLPYETFIRLSALERGETVVAGGIAASEEASASVVPQKAAKAQPAKA